MPQELNKKPSIKDPQPVSPDFLNPLILEQIFNFIYPVGSYYFNKTDPRNPKEIFGIGCGTWVAETARVLVGKSGSGTFATLGSTGGSETHTLSVSEMPSHTHTSIDRMLIWDASKVSMSGPAAGWQIQSSGWGGTVVNNTGGGGSHNNLQPYITVMMWYRTA